MYLFMIAPLPIISNRGPFALGLVFTLRPVFSLPNLETIQQWHHHLKSGWPIVWVELEGATLLDSYPSCRVIFKASGWYDYCRALSRHHPAVTRTFAKGFDGEKVKFETMVLQITEDSIAKATSLPMDGEKWFKRTTLKPSDFNHLLVDDHRDPD